MLFYIKPKIFDVDLYGLSLLLALGALSWLFLLKPLNEKLRYTNRDQQKHNQQKQAYQNELDQLTAIVRSKQAITRHALRNADLLNRKTDIPDVIRGLERLAHQCGLRLDEITPSLTASDEHFYKTLMALKLYGSFPTLQDFMRRVARELPFIRIKELILNRKDAEEGWCTIRVVLDVFAAK